ncbi:624_t:CDS:2 [Paraglomus brasilianum]|uniref:Probable 26S proteasome regulatory subunit p27 n=1 Tax=Paraglomus brasilianum TaxID=144538 RepID=A0A9N9G7A9_9GLOM|nr:624_t:CDS:2 [Paraglomus brasilianum]
MGLETLTDSSARIRANELITQKDSIENEIKEQEQILKGQGVGMSEPLVDRSGFPRDDIDLVVVRTARARIIALRNDHKDVMNEIEKMLHIIHAEAKAKTVVKEEEKEHSMYRDLRNECFNEEREGVAYIVFACVDRVTAFALVNAVAPDSPASEAGLQRNDKIVRFGHLHADNHRALQAVNLLVSESENKSIDVTIERGDEGQRLVLKLTPRRGWGGRGLLGCHILPTKGAK